jgi:hypothetical protein
MSEGTDQLPGSVGALLASFVRRRRRVALVRAMGVAVLVAALWLLSWGLVDRLVPLHGTLRAALLCLLASAVTWVLMRPLRAVLRRDVSWVEAARQIEQRDDRFNEALVTVVSERVHGPGGTSLHLVDHLTSQVESQIAAAPGLTRRLVPLRPAATALAAAFVAAFVMLDLCMWQWLGLPTLLGRQVAPLADIPAVTTTRLEVLTGSTQVMPGRPVTIIARAQPANPESPVLRCSVDGKTFSFIPMTAAPDGSLYCTLSSVTRDTTYRVQAGDAVSQSYKVQILRRPVVRELRIRLTYPQAIAREPLGLTVRGGEIEAPIGASAGISIIASEPLADAYLVHGDHQVSSERTAEPNVRRVELQVTSDLSFAVDVVSDRGVKQAGAAQLNLRAIADRPPVARSPLQGGTYLLKPDDSLVVSFDAADDYALASVEARVRIGADTPFRLPLSIGDDPRHCDGSFKLDLARMSVSIGQVLEVSVWAMDRAGQFYSTQPARLLVAPRSVTPEQQRVAQALDEALQTTRAVVSQLGEIQAADPRTGFSQLSSASDAAPMIVQALLDAAARSTADDRATVLGQLIDEAQVLACRLEQLNEDARSARADDLSARLMAAKSDAARLQQRIATLFGGHASRMILAAHQCQRELGAPLAVEVEKLIAPWAKDLQLAPGSPDVDAQLQARAQEADAMTKSATPTDFVQLARQWTPSAQSAEPYLAERLEAAAQAFALRADAAAQFAPDLHLASRAVQGIESQNQAAAARDVRDQFLAALAMLTHPASSDRRDLERARQSMRIWAGEQPGGESYTSEQGRTGAPSRPEPASRPRDTSPQVQPPPVADPSAPTRDPRQQALAAIGRAQQALARMPELLDKTEQAADWLRQTKRRAQDAQAALQDAAGNQQPAARRNVLAAQAQFAEASKTLSDLGRSLDPDYTWTMSQELKALGPQTQPGVIPMQQELAPALETLHASIEASDPAATELSASDVRYAISLAQDGLRDARQGLLERDPLVGARWFAEQTSGTVGATQPQGWPRRRAQQPISPGDVDLPGYQDALRAYFGVLEQAKSE